MGVRVCCNRKEETRRGPTLLSSSSCEGGRATPPRGALREGGAPKRSGPPLRDFQQVLAGASQDLVCFCNLDTTSLDEALKSIHNVVMQAAGFTFQKVSPHKHVPNRSKPWFDTECKHIKLNYLSLVKLQSPSEIIKSARREFRTLVRYKRR
jgi:hypothetical protein